MHNSDQVDHVLISLDLSIKSDCLFQKFERQRKSFLKYCSKRDEILQHKPPYIPLEYYRDCNILIKYPHLLHNLSYQNDKEFILLYLTKHKKKFGIKIEIPHDQDLDFIVKAIQANYQVFPKLFPVPPCGTFRYSHSNLVKKCGNSLSDNLVNYFVKLNPKVLIYVNWKEVDREVIMDALKEDISLCMNGDREMMMLAIECNPLALKYARFDMKKDEEIVLKAISQDKNMLQYAHDSIIERILGKNELIYYSTEDRLELFRGCYGIFKYLPQDLQSNSDFIMEMLNKGFGIQNLLPITMIYDSGAHFSLSHYSSVNEKHTFITIQGTDNYKQILKNFSITPRELRTDKSFVLELLDKYPGKIMEVDASLLDDPDIISFIISKDPSMFEYASERLQDDFDFIMEHIEKYPEIYTNVSARLRGNKEIIYKYVSRADRPYFCAKPFVDDEEFLLKLVERNSNFLSSLDSVSPELARKCIERNGSSYATLIERRLISASDALIQLAALSTGFLFEKHSFSLVACEGGEAGEVIRPSISVTRNEVDLWIKKRLESAFDGLYISFSSPMFVKGNFVTVNETVYTFKGKTK